MLCAVIIMAWEKINNENRKRLKNGEDYFLITKGSRKEVATYYEKTKDKGSHFWVGGLADAYSEYEIKVKDVVLVWIGRIA